MRETFLKENMKKGFNILNFINEDIKKEDFIYKWTKILLNDMRVCIFKYEGDGSVNPDAGDLDFVKTFFRNGYKGGELIESFLLDLFTENMENFEDIVIALYGLGSPELKVVRKFNKLYENIDNWNEYERWRDPFI